MKNDVTAYNDGMFQIDTDNGEYAIFKDSDIAGKLAREYWQEMAENDPDEFACMVGQEALVAWSLGRSYSVGSVATSSLEKWLDLWLDVPEEYFASYDGDEREIEYVSRDLLRELDDDITWIDSIRKGYAVAYRQN